MAVLLVSNGLTATALSVYDESILKEFGWTRGELKFRDLISFWLIALLAPLGGVLIDRFGPRRMLSAGFVLLSIAYLLYSRLSSLGMLYGIHVIMAVGLLCAGTMTCIILLSNWFDAKRGLALGIALVGTSLGGIVLSPVNAALIQHLGWRRTFQIEAALPIAMMLVVLLVVKNSPREVGASAVGVDVRSKRDLRLEGLTLPEAMRTRSFWAIGLSGMLTYYSILALYSHLFLHMRGLGYEPVKAGFALSLLAMLALTGKLITGALADRLERRRLFVGSLAVMLVGLVGLATLKASAVLPSIAIIGLGWGGVYTLYNVLSVTNFGLKSAGRINGMISTLESLGGGLGIWLTGALYDRYGSYQVAFSIMVAFVFAGMLLGTQIRNEVKQA
jgi:sugar phosphate permease